MQFSVATILAIVSVVSAHQGRMTYYEPGLGACGWTNSDSDHVVALDPTQFTSANTNDDPVCGKHISISYNGQTVTAEVADKCPSCAPGAIDVAPSVFESCAPLDEGVVQVTWDFI